MGVTPFVHVKAGIVDQLSRSPVRRRLTTAPAASIALTAVGVDQLVLVAFADLYVRLCSMGVWTDWRTYEGVTSHDYTSRETCFRPRLQPALSTLARDL